MTTASEATVTRTSNITLGLAGTMIVAAVGVVAWVMSQINAVNAELKPAIAEVRTELRSINNNLRDLKGSLDAAPTRREMEAYVGGEIEKALAPLRTRMEVIESRKQ